NGRFKTTVALSVLLLLAATARAHDPGLSMAVLEIGDQAMVADLTFSRPDIETLVPIDTNRDGQTSPQEWAAARLRMELLARELLEVCVDDRTLVASVGTIQHNDSNAVEFHLEFPTGTGSQLAVSAPILTKLSPGHRQYLTVRNGDGNAQREALLDARHSLLEMPMPQSGV